MAEIVVCAALYESGRKYFGDFVSGFLTACRHHDAEAVFAIDDLRDTKITVAPVAEEMPVRFVGVAPGTSIAGVRRAMLEAVRETSSRYVVFSDMDDWLTPDAITRHKSALERGSFSYGDQYIVDARGRFSGICLYDDWNVPQKITGMDALMKWNFVGFGAAAIRRSCLTADLCRIPETVKAPDWWFFSMALNAGCNGVRTDGPVANYRQHEGSFLGANSQIGLPVLITRCNFAIKHFKALPQCKQIQNRLASIVDLKEILQRAPQRLEPYYDYLSSRRFAWFEEITWLADVVMNNVTKE